MNKGCLGYIREILLDIKKGLQGYLLGHLKLFALIFMVLTLGFFDNRNR